MWLTPQYIETKSDGAFLQLIYIIFLKYLKEACLINQLNCHAN